MGDQIDLGGVGLLAMPDPEPPAGPPIAMPATGGGQDEGQGDDRGAAVRQPEEQIDLGRPLEIIPVEPRQMHFGWRTPESAAYARQARAVKLAQEKAQANSSALARTQGALDGITALLPKAAQLVGRSATQHVDRKQKLSPSDFVVLCRAAHLRASTDLSFGHTPQACDRSSGRLGPSQTGVGHGDVALVRTTTRWAS